VRAYLFFPPDLLLRLRDPFRRGTFAPFERASLSPIAMACFRLFTLRPEPLFNVPFFRRRMADSTRFDAALPYLAIKKTSELSRAKLVLVPWSAGGVEAGFTRPGALT
jgi:hypothetical protein